MSSLPQSTEAARTVCAGVSQDPSEAYSVTPSPPRHSKVHFARSRSSSPVHGAHNELEASSPPSSPAESQHPRIRSDSVQNGLATSSPPPKPQSLDAPKYPVEADGADYLPPGFQAFPKCCYNYESFIPPSPPPVVPWSRRQLYNTIVNTSPPIFLSCSWTNPIHLACVIAPGGKWSATETIAENMTPAVYHEYVENLQGWKRVEGVLVAGLQPKLMEEMEVCTRNKYRERHERRVGEVAVEIDDGDVIDVAAYMYQKAQVA
ncbi:uncharacterized protein M421DRAFT_415536 [Didymella exigua CBS 183.55]|uniref:Uncharacterized protein n=1 Tax=Didymella exigua CBS 183.55 TaxID=1150837 RepID=A0A6A5RZ86_9PLEO|nr:uncharacterized protein M421DRAFT_415536 [Didymella exigua CBS 183.55]KAF1933172.1 hypothetical protein M421DRAFT_415536 [Didymella exigua CBS 183.55]